MTEEMVKERPQAAVGDALDKVRTATQELHVAIRGTLETRAEAGKSEIEALVRQAERSAELARSAMKSRFETAQGQIQEHLGRAAERLDATRKHAFESLEASGVAVRESLTKALAEARASVQDISEAVAAKRAERAARHKSNQSE